MKEKQEDILSVIVPNYNNEKYLVACLDSILQQTWQDMEILVVDDCSTDGSLEILRAYEKHFPQIRLICQPQNGGVSKARNRGLEEAKGKYITYLDADDIYINPEKLQKEMELLKQKEKLGINSAVYSRVVHLKENGERSLYQPSTRKWMEGNILIELLSTFNTAVVPRDYCIRTEVLRQVGAYREDMYLFEDFELLVRLAKKADFYCSGVSGTGYRIKETGLSAQQGRKRCDQIMFQILKQGSKDLTLWQRGICYARKYFSYISRRGKESVSRMIRG